MSRRIAFLGCVFGALLGCGGGASSPTVPQPAPAAPVSAASLAGTWTLTVTASSVCTQIPSQYRRRSYTATVTAAGSSFEANLTGASFAAPSSVSGRLTAGSAQITFYLYESVSSYSWIQILTDGTATPGATRMAGSMNGSFSLYDLLGTTVGCNATDHQFAFSR